MWSLTYQYTGTVPGTYDNHILNFERVHVIKNIGLLWPARLHVASPLRGVFDYLSYVFGITTTIISYLIVVLVLVLTYKIRDKSMGNLRTMLQREPVLFKYYYESGLIWYC